MKQVILKCDNCDEEFFTEYYIGGYIDHQNLSENLPNLVKDSDEDITYFICRNGNEFRYKYDIEKRLNCFCIYCDKHNLTELKQRIVEAVEEQVQMLEKLDVLHDEIYEKVENLTQWQKAYLGLEYQAFDCKRGN